MEQEPKVIVEAQVEPKILNSRRAWHLIDKSVGATTLHVGVTEWEAHRPLEAMHQHDVEEIMYVISGHGALHTPTTVYDLPLGAAVYAPPGVPHVMQNAGNEPLKFFWVYAVKPDA